MRDEYLVIQLFVIFEILKRMILTRFVCVTKGEQFLCGSYVSDSHVK